MMGIALDKLPHSGGAFPLHFVRHIVVDIQGKGGGGVAQVPLHGLDVISGADRRNCVGMPLWYNKFVQFLSVSTPSLCADKPWYFRIFSI